MINTHITIREYINTHTKTTPNQLLLILLNTYGIFGARNFNRTNFALFSIQVNFRKAKILRLCLSPNIIIHPDGFSFGNLGLYALVLY